MGFDKRKFANSIANDARLFQQFKQDPQNVLGKFGLRIDKGKADLVKKQIEKAYNSGVTEISKVLGEF